MSESSESFPIDESGIIKSCYNCNIQIVDASQKICHNCNTILNPNDLMWKNSFFSFLCILCILPILIAVISSLISNL